MGSKLVPFTDLLSAIVDNRGRTCPVGDSGLPLIATNCISNDTLYPKYETTRFVDEKTYQSWFRGHPQPGDILFVCKGSPGRTNWVPDPVDFCIAQDMVAVRADVKKVYPKYLFAMLRSQPVQQQIENMHVGTLIPHFKKGDFDKLQIPLADEATQKAIGDIYFSFLEKIELNRRMNETLEAMTRALFKAWFVDFEPVRAKLEGRWQRGQSLPGLPAHLYDLFPDRLVDSELGEIPEGWGYKPLSNFICIFDSQRVPLSSKQRAKHQGPYPYHGATGIMDYVDDHLFDGIFVLLGEDGSVVRTNGCPYTQYVWGKFWVNNHAHVLRGQGISNETLLVFLEQCNVTPYITGAVQPKLSQGNLKSIPFIDAGKNTFNEFGRIIAPFYSQIRKVSDQSHTLIRFRETLLPKLISGELRVPDAEHLAEDPI